MQLTLACETWGRKTAPFWEEVSWVSLWLQASVERAESQFCVILNRVENMTVKTCVGQWPKSERSFCCHPAPRLSGYLLLSIPSPCLHTLSFASDAAPFDWSSSDGLLILMCSMFSQHSFKASHTICNALLWLSPWHSLGSLGEGSLSEGFSTLGWLVGMVWRIFLIELIQPTGGHATIWVGVLNYRRGENELRTNKWMYTALCSWLWMGCDCLFRFLLPWLPINKELNLNL